MLFLGAGVFLFLVGAREDGINDGIHSPVSNLSFSLSVSALVPMKLFKNVSMYITFVSFADTLPFYSFCSLLPCIGHQQS